MTLLPTAITSCYQTCRRCGRDIPPGAVAAVLYVPRRPVYYCYPSCHEARQEEEA